MHAVPVRAVAGGVANAGAHDVSQRDMERLVDNGSLTTHGVP